MNNLKKFNKLKVIFLNLLSFAILEEENLSLNEINNRLRYLIINALFLILVTENSKMKDNFST